MLRIKVPGFETCRMAFFSLFSAMAVEGISSLPHKSMSAAYSRILVAAVFMGLALEAFAAARKALVIGNARYEEAAGPLRNTDNDAKSVARTLRTLGFDVIERHNLNRDQFLRAVDDFRKTLNGAEVALFFYAGHGVSLAGSNYLIPIKSGFEAENARDETTLRVLAETRLFNAEQAIADMSAAGARCNLAILDACRTTPLLPKLTRDAMERGGLSEMTPPAGSLIAFSTDAGKTALDGEGANGLYTEELLKNLRTPGLTIEQVFKRTRAGVLSRSQGSQVPAEYSRLVGEDVYLAGTNIPAASSQPEDRKPPPDVAALVRLAAAGNTEECINRLQQIASERGPGDYAAQPLDAALERVKVDLGQATTPSPRVEDAATTCALVLRVLPECLPLDHPMATQLYVKARNRYGDALLVLGRPGEALKQFNDAISLSTSDAYIFYNRGRAHLALGDKESAKADFVTASSDRFDQPGAKRLARLALQQLD